MQILVTPEPILRLTSKAVKQWDKKLDQEVKAMINTMQKAKDPEGVGLAAPQVGITKRIFVLDLDGDIQIFVNPRVIARSKQNLSDKYTNPKKRFMEGCLSVPRLWGFVDRPYSVTLEYQYPEAKDNKYELVTVQEQFSDMASSYVQHELDHLDGILFTDRIIEQKGTIFQETPNGLQPIKL